jgi:biopolymer transport protein ExbD
LDDRAIKSTITRLTAERPDAAVVIKAEKKAKTRAIIAAVDGIKAAGVPKPTISLAKD